MPSVVHLIGCVLLSSHLSKLSVSAGSIFISTSPVYFYSYYHIFKNKSTLILFTDYFTYTVILMVKKEIKLQKTSIIYIYSITVYVIINIFNGFYLKFLKWYIYQLKLLYLKFISIILYFSFFFELIHLYTL